MKKKRALCCNKCGREEPMVRRYVAAIGDGLDLCPGCAALMAKRIHESRERKREHDFRLN
jgi:hypothetical protein